MEAFAPDPQSAQYKIITVSTAGRGAEVVMDVAACVKASINGFVNFPMDSFGVVHEPLRSIAAGPQLPEYHPPGQSAGVDDGQPFLWNGVRFKSITTKESALQPE